LNSGHPHIVVDLKLRLGNQLFQFAAAKQLELDGASVAFSNRTYQPSGALAESPERLERFVGEKLQIASPIEELLTGYLPPPHLTSPRMNIVLRAPIVFPTTHRVFRPACYEAKPTLPAWSHFRIQAYFQHRSWFDRSLASVLKRIETATHETRTQFPTFDLCVNLRRGDYIGLGWIKSVVVTSDDRLAARAISEYLRSEGYDARTANDVNLASHHEAQNPVDPVLRDFCLIANSRNLVMSNSTFCWWAAELGGVVTPGSGDRIVAYPRGWVEFADDESDGLVRPEWTVVPS
jgi:Glycosyl transferase family 11